MPTETIPAVNNKFQFFDEYFLGEYTLFIDHLNGKEADDLAANIEQYIKEEFKKRNPIVCTLYDLEIEESEVYYGSRRSQQRGKLVRKKEKTFSGKINIAFSRLLIALNIIAMDPAVVTKNFESVVHGVEKVFNISPKKDLHKNVTITGFKRGDNSHHDKKK